jgi:endonuclease YncB( thermonuclease family)
MRTLLGIATFVFCLTAGQIAFADPCTAPLPSQGSDFSGQVRYVGDGDSLCVGQSSNPATWIEVRVADFYAPELHSSGGLQAKAALERIAMGQMARCRAGRRSYDRVVAQCFVGGKSIGDRMREAGIREGGRGR